MVTHEVDVVDSFVYLGSHIDAAGGSESDIRRRIELICSCNVWWYSIITHGTPLSACRQRSDYTIHTYSRSCCMVQIHGVWWKNPVDVSMLDMWCLRRISHIPYTAHITNKEVRRRTNQDPVTSLIASRRLRLFGHITRSSVPSLLHLSSYQPSPGGLEVPKRST